MEANKERITKKLHEVMMDEFGMSIDQARLVVNNTNLAEHVQFEMNSVTEKQITQVLISLIVHITVKMADIKPENRNQFTRKLPKMIHEYLDRQLFISQLGRKQMRQTIAYDVFHLDKLWKGQTLTVKELGAIFYEVMRIQTGDITLNECIENLKK